MSTNLILKMTRRQFLKTSAVTAALVAASDKIIPTQASMFAPATALAAPSAEVKHGLCHSCHFGKCSVLYTVKDGVLTGVEGDPDGPWNHGTMCVRGNGAIMYLYNAYRVKSPLKRTNPQKGLDVDPKWVEISWDEAINTVAEKLNTARKQDPRTVIWLGGFPSQFSTILRTPLAAVIGTPNTASATGSLCSVHHSNAFHHGGFVHWPDFEYGKYVIAIGGTFGPNHAASDGGSDYVVSAIQNGTKVVVVDPHCSTEAGLGEWVPIRPGTEFPYLLAIANVMLHEQKKFDEWWVKNRTTGPYLIGADGYYVRDAASKKPLVWDASSNSAKTFDDASIKDFALEGSYQVADAQVRPAFDLLKAGVKQYTPEWAADITTVSADTIRRHATELIQAAQIGSTININGFTFPLRPASIYIGRGITGHRDGHLAFWMAMVINELIGAVDVPGGNVHLASPEALKPDVDGVVTPEARRSPFTPWKFPPNTIHAQEYLPYGFSGGYRLVDAIVEPDKYRVPYKPAVLLNWAANFFTKGAGDPERISEALRRIPFTVSVAYHFDEHTMFADVVIPDATYIEQTATYNFEMHRPGSATKVTANLTNKPIVEPLNQARAADSVAIDLAERMGVLFGQGGLNDLLNRSLRFKPELALALDKKYTPADVIDRILRTTYGDKFTLDAVSQKGFALIEVPPEKAYSYFYFPGNKTRHPLYHVNMKKAGDQLLAGLKQAGIQHPGLSEEDIRFYYQGVPAWKPTPVQNPPAGFDLYSIMWKIPEFLFDIAAVQSNPYLQEALEDHPDFGKVLMNASTAAKRGLKDGDQVFMESMYGGRIGPYPIKTTQLMHPEVVGVASGLGRSAAGMNPIVKNGILYNRLLSTKWEYIDVWTGSIGISPRVKITKA